MNKADQMLPVGWHQCSIDEVAELFRGVTYKKEQSASVASEGKTPILRANNIGGVINYENLVYVDTNLIKSSQYVQIGDVVIAMSSGSEHLVGKSAQKVDDFLCAFGAFCGLLRPSKHINSKFFGWFLKSDNYNKHIQKQSKGTNINNLKREHVLTTAIPVAPLNEQNRIVARIEELFSELDAGVESLTKAKEQLGVYRQSLLKHAFEGKLTEEWRRENANKIESGEALLKRVKKERAEYFKKQLEQWGKDVALWEANGKRGKKPTKPKEPKKLAPISEEELKELPELPDGWAWVTIGQLVAQFEAGKSFKCDERPPHGNEWGIIKVSAVTWGAFNENESKTVTDESKIDYDCVIRPGDFLFSRANTVELVGASVIAGEFSKKLLLSDKILRFVFPVDTKQWVNEMLKTRFCRNQIENMATGNQFSMRNLSQPKIASIKLPLPGKDELAEIMSRYHSALSDIALAETQINAGLQRARLLKASVLESAFAGNLVPQDPNDEPALTLLKRIKQERGNVPKPKRMRKAKAKNKRITMADLKEVLAEASEWMNAREAFRQCGIGDGAPTDLIEKLYEELKEQVAQRVVEVERRGDEDWFRLITER